MVKETGCNVAEGSVLSRYKALCRLYEDDIARYESYLERYASESLMYTMYSECLHITRMHFRQLNFAVFGDFDYDGGHDLNKGDDIN